MTLIKRLMITLATVTSFAGANAAEALPQELVDDSGWQIVANNDYTIHFPTKPKIDKKGDSVTYSSLDSSNYPVVMYSFVVQTSKTPVDAEEQVYGTLEKLSTYPSNLLHHEVVESADEIVLDTLCSDAKTRVMRCERMIIAKDKIYTLTTLFFPMSAENHEYFVGHFVKQ